MIPINNGKFMGGNCPQCRHFGTMGLGVRHGQPVIHSECSLAEYSASIRSPEKSPDFEGFGCPTVHHHHHHFEMAKYRWSPLNGVEWSFRRRTPRMTSRERCRGRRCGSSSDIKMATKRFMESIHSASRSIYMILWYSLIFYIYMILYVCIMYILLLYNCTI